MSARSLATELEARPVDEAPHIGGVGTEPGDPDHWYVRAQGGWRRP